ncbi:MAG: 4Fe-4S binding protein [Clostridia bacterium]|jgi:ferredoxin|nr:4Fe-4S binding protein [Clostridia bacterium]
MGVGIASIISDRGGIVKGDKKNERRKVDGSSGGEKSADFMIISSARSLYKIISVWYNAECILCMECVKNCPKEAL